MHILDQIERDGIKLERIMQMARFASKYNESSLKTFEEVAEAGKKAIIDKPYYKAYLNIVKNTAQFIKETGGADPISASIIFEYLLWNGYLSKDKKLVYSISGRINNTSVIGADIMRGKSVCLNNAEMLTRVLNDMNFEAYLTGCGIFPDKNKKREYIPSIKRTMVKRPIDKFIENITYPLGRLLGNHAVTLVKTDKGYYLSDPTSLAFVYMTDFLKARYIGIDLDMQIKPTCTFALGIGSNSEYISALLQSSFEIGRQTLSLDNIKELYESIIQSLDKQKTLLDDFHDSNKQDIDTVCKTLTHVNIH